MTFKKVCILISTAGLAVSIAGCGDQHDRPDGAGIFWPKSKAPYRLFNTAVAKKTFVTFSTGYHTATPVPVGSMGPSRFTKKLSGIVLNTDISAVMLQAINEGVSVIIVIGDGFGPFHMSIPSLINAATGCSSESSFENIMKNGGCGFSHTYAYSSLVTDSGAAATALACGVKTDAGKIGIGPDGKKLTSIMDIAKKAGMKTGIVTDTRVTHATPASFYGHSAYREDEELIAVQLADDNDIDVILGGGARYFIPRGSHTKDNPLLKTIAIDGPSKRNDARDLIAKMNNSGYTVVCDIKGLLSQKKQNEKLLGIFAAGHMNSSIDRDDEKTGEPSIVDMTKAGLDVLSTGRRGFFLMIECGRLDYDSHFNDMGAIIRGVMEMEQVVNLCLGFQRKRPASTLLIFTGDHETGGPSLSYYTPETAINKPDSPRKTGSSYPPIKDFSRFLKQKKSLRMIFSSVQSVEELRDELRMNIPNTITEDKAKEIFRLINGDHYQD